MFPVFCVCQGLVVCPVLVSTFYWGLEWTEERANKALLSLEQQNPGKKPSPDRDPGVGSFHAAASSHHTHQHPQSSFFLKCVRLV